MAIDYTDWPTIADLTAKLAAANITLGGGVSADQKQAVIDAAVNLMEYSSGRQFKPGALGEVRYYDGSGTGAMEIDEYIDITSIEFFQVPATTTVAIENWVEVTRVPYPKTKIQILQGPANMLVGWWTMFPQGRSNIKITGQYGYGANIPAAVWNAVLELAAANMADQARVTPQGVLSGFKDLDQDFKWSDQTIGMLTNWRQNFAQVLKMFKRPLRAYLGRNTPVLI